MNNTTKCPTLTDDKFVAVDDVVAVLTISVNFLTCPLIVLLNALIIIAVGTKRRLQTAHNILLASMAGTDLFVGIFLQPRDLPHIWWITIDVLQVIADSICGSPLSMPCIPLTPDAYRLRTPGNEIFLTVREYRDKIPCNYGGCMLLACLASLSCSQA